MTSMNPELIDDREYRRGMILGLTLAEVLLLLLFLLMLALGSELIDLQDRLGRAEDGTAAEQNRVLQADLTEA
ncbi:MAG: hypothetical protein KDJ29_19985, partial [Hyphomicrobiales bacterium]|nr:hypothetical protein [Hyphomicrobiales bacterium]